MKSFSTVVKSSVLGGALLTGFSLACGPSMEPGRVMTPEERLREQEMLAYEAEKEHRDDDGGDLGPVEEDAEPFDEKQAKMELKRASRSASTCDDVVEKKDAKGTADIAIIFSRDGSVKDVTVSGPYGDGEIGQCILNAYKAVIVPPFTDEEFAMSWVLDMSGKQEVDEEAAALEKKIFGSKDVEEEEGKDKKGKKKSKKKK